MMRIMAAKKGTNRERRKAGIYPVVLSWNRRHECELMFCNIDRNK